MGFDVFGILFTIVFGVILVMFIVTLIRGIGQWNRNNHSPRLTVEASVTAKRTQVSHHHDANGPSPHLHPLLRHLSGGERRPNGTAGLRPGVRDAGRRGQGPPHLPGDAVPGV